MVVEVNGDNFNDITEKGLSVIQFSAEWCGPCKMVTPTIEGLSNEYSDVKFGKVNVDSNQDLAVKYGVRSIPAIFFLKDGKVESKILGNKTKDEYKDTLDNLK